MGIVSKPGNDATSGKCSRSPQILCGKRPRTNRHQVSHLARIAVLRQGTPLASGSLGNGLGLPNELASSAASSRIVSPLAVFPTTALRELLFTVVGEK